MPSPVFTCFQHASQHAADLTATRCVAVMGILEMTTGVSVCSSSGSSRHTMIT